LRKPRFPANRPNALVRDSEADRLLFDKDHIIVRSRQRVLEAALIKKAGQSGEAAGGPVVVAAKAKPAKIATAIAATTSDLITCISTALG
jgi:hypothetical protein